MLRNKRWSWLVSLMLTITVFAPGCSKQTKMERHLKRANEYFDSKQNDQAEIEYMNALRLGATNRIAIKRTAGFRLNKGDIATAFRLFLKMKELDPNDLDSRIKLGEVYLVGRDQKNARAEAEFVLSRDPENEKALFMLSDTAISPEEIKTTKLLLEKMLQKGLNKGPIHVALGYLQMRQKDLVAAAASFKQAEASTPKSSASYLAIAQFYLTQTNLASADQAFQTAIRLAESKSEPQFLYADFKLRSGAKAEAKEMLQGINRSAPDYFPPYLSLAKIAFAETNFSGCGTLLSEALARNPSNVEALLLRANLRLAKGETAAGVKELQDLKSAHPEIPSIHYQLAVAFLRTNGVAKATVELNEAIRLDPNHAQAILLAADLNIRRGDAAPAVTALYQLVQQQPDLIQAQMLLAAAYRARGTPGDAAAVYREVMLKFPQASEIPFLLGITLREQNKPEEAREVFKKAEQLAPDSISVLTQLVELDLGMKEGPAALQRLKGRIEKHPEMAQLRYLLARVYLALQDHAQAEAVKFFL